MVMSLQLVNTFGDIDTRDGAQVVAGPVFGTVNLTSSNPPKANATQTCYNALFQTDPSEDRSKLTHAKGKRVAGTCEWIREHATYQSWVQGDMHLLWICGGPGKGKTMLSIFVTEELESLAQESRGSEVFYFFCNNGDSKLNSATSVLRGLLWQLVAKQPGLAQHTAQYFDTPEKARASANSPDVLWNTLLKVLQDSKLRIAFCVLDGLDECDGESQRWIAAKASDMKSSGSVVKLLIVSRDIHYLRSSEAQIKLDSDNDKWIRQDIEKFVSTRVESLMADDSYFRKEIARKVLEKSEGTFLWIGFAMMELQSKRTPTEIEETLDALPKGLPAIYSRMLLQIDDKHRKNCSNILGWITLAARPLSFHELAAATGTESTALLSRKQVIRDQVTMCGFILKVQEPEIRLVHQSAKDYLLRGEVDGNPSLEKYYRIRPEEAHVQIAWACLDCMKQSNLQDVPLDRAIADPFVLSDFLSQQQPLLPYAVDHWFEHAAYSSVVAERIMEHPSGIFKRKSKLRDDWWRVYVNRTSLSQATDLPSLHIASFLGVTQWARVLLKRDKMKPKPYRLVSKGDSQGRKPLHLASHRGHRATAQLLIEGGADINARNSRGRTALVDACETGQVAIVKLLLDHGADPNPKSKSRESTPLHEAARSNHEAVLRVLLDRKAATEARSATGWTPLYDAVYSGHEVATRILLEEGADVDATEAEFGFAPLHEAARRGHVAMIQLLLNWNANVNIRTGYGATPLREAAVKGHWKAVQLLLDRGALIDLKDQEWVTTSLGKHRESDTMNEVVESTSHI